MKTILDHNLEAARIVRLYFERQLALINSQLLVRWIFENPNHLVRPKVVALLKENRDSEALELVERHLPCAS